MVCDPVDLLINRVENSILYFGIVSWLDIRSRRIEFQQHEACKFLLKYPQGDVEGDGDRAYDVESDNSDEDDDCDDIVNACHAMNAKRMRCSYCMINGIMPPGCSICICIGTFTIVDINRDIHHRP
ncbi:hypothetical protein QYF36_002619 [Acer negundo]|nr:hypothetical protein QYF36_002619 [Acer negundo]